MFTKQCKSICRLECVRNIASLLDMLVKSQKFANFAQRMENQKKSTTQQYKNLLSFTKCMPFSWRSLLLTRCKIKNKSKVHHNLNKNASFIMINIILYFRDYLLYIIIDILMEDKIFDIQDIANIQYAKKLDEQDPLKNYREKFHIPIKNGKNVTYFVGNSLGLQPKSTSLNINKILQQWKEYGIQGVKKGDKPWLTYHNTVGQKSANLFGARAKQISIMNTLTVNLNCLLISFYQPKGKRTKIICLKKEFPSDQYAIQSHIKLHGLIPQQHIIQIAPKQGEYILKTQDIIHAIQKAGEQLALIMISAVNYYTGQVYALQQIVKKGHEVGAFVGFDCAHAVGNIQLKLHQWQVDFACWCSYKYLNSGPGGIGGLFVHQKHHNTQFPRLNGWFGNKLSTRFLMKQQFEPEEGAAAWTQSNPPIFSIASFEASVQIFQEAGMERLCNKRDRLTSYLQKLLKSIPEVKLITPQNLKERGCQLSIIVNTNGKVLYNYLQQNNIGCDWREPDVIRVAAVPLYNTFEDCYILYRVIQSFYES